MVEFTEWLHEGFRGIIPVAPPDAETADNKIRKNAGKVPAQKTPRGWVGFPPFLTHQATAADAVMWSGWGANVGLQAALFPAVDIDVTDTEQALAVEAVAREVLGHAPCRIGRAPKRLLMFRLADSAEPFRARVLKFRDEQGNDRLVEILGAGRQYVVDGEHPATRSPYAWDSHPTWGGAAMLTPITGSMMQDFVDRLKEVMSRKYGWLCTSKNTTINSLAGAESSLGCAAQSIDEVKEAVSYLPNTVDTSRDDYIAMLYAIRGSLPDHEADAFDLAAEWAMRWPGDDNVEKVRADWDRMAKPYHSGWLQLREEAAQYGFDYLKFQFGIISGVRPIVRVTGGGIARVVDRAEKALINANVGIYQRGGILVRPVRSPVPTTDERKVVTPRLVTVTKHHLAEEMTKAAHWQSFSKTDKDWVAINTPMNIAETYLAREGLWNLPHLTGIVTAPTLRPDGSILEQPGYDYATGLMFEPCGAVFPPVPRFPSRDQAQEALSVLSAVVSSFPFVAPADTAVALSSILTAMVRRSLPAAPMHAFTAPTAGSGKSLLVDIAAMIATGQTAPVIAQGKTEEETEKRLGAMLIAGDGIVSVDNCEAPLGGDILCQILTQPCIKVRLLGQSRMVEVIPNATMFATGNNLEIQGDMTRRALLCSLDPQCERPEMRRFGGQHPLEAIRAGRAKYALAALVILRAYYTAERPKMADPLGSFEAWSDIVRSALIWLGMADPASTIETARATDPKLNAAQGVIEHWRNVLGNKRVSVKDVIDAATGNGVGVTGLLDDHAEFREALLVVAGDGGAINSRRLGKWLGKHKNRVFNGAMLVPDGMLAGTLTWRLVINGTA